MTNQEFIESLDKSIPTTNRWLGFFGGLALAGLGLAADFDSCSHQLALPVNYPILSSTPFAVEKPEFFTGEAQPFTGVAATASGKETTVSGNMVVLKDRAHYTWQGPSVPTVTWDFDAKHALSIDPVTQKMTMQRTAQGSFGISCQEETTFDASGVSVSQIACSIMGTGPYKSALKTSDKDDYKYGAAKETITGALVQAMDMFNTDLKKNSLSAHDDRFVAQMRRFFVSNFSNMDTSTTTYSVLSPLKTSSTASGVQVSGNHVSFGDSTVQVHDNGAVESTQKYDDGNKTVSVLIDPNGTVQATHRYKGANDHLAFEFTHIMTPNKEVCGWVQYSDEATGTVIHRIQLKPAILDKRDMTMLNYGAYTNGKAANALIKKTGSVNMSQTLRVNAG